MFSPTNHQYYVVLQSTNKTEDIIFYSTTPYVFNEIDKKTLTFESNQSVKKGIYPHGKSFGILNNYDSIVIHIPFISDKNFIKNEIIVENIEINLIINGVKKFQIKHAERQTVALLKHDNRTWASFGLAIPNNYFEK